MNASGTSLWCKRFRERLIERGLSPDEAWNIYERRFPYGAPHQFKPEDEADFAFAEFCIDDTDKEWTMVFASVTILVVIGGALILWGFA